MNRDLQIIIDPESINIDKWAEFVKHHDKRNVFQTPEMYFVYKKSGIYEPLVFTAMKGDTICGVVVAYILKEHKGLLGKFSSRAVIWGGPLVSSPEVMHILLSKLNFHLKNKIVYTQFRNIFSVENFRDSFESSGYFFEDHQDILIDLTRGVDFIWENIHKNRKKEIKNGLKKGLNVTQVFLAEQDILHDLYDLLQKLYKRIKLPVPPLTFFISAVNNLEKTGYLKTFVAKVEEKIVGFRMILTYGGLIYDWYAASDQNYLNYRPNDVLPWEILKWGCENKYERFDFGGAGKPNEAYGVRDYKLKFGGSLVNYGRYNRINNKPLYYFAKTAFQFKRTIGL